MTEKHRYRQSWKLTGSIKLEEISECATNLLTEIRSEPSRGHERRTPNYSIENPSCAPAPAKSTDAQEPAEPSYVEARFPEVTAISRIVVTSEQ